MGRLRCYGMEIGSTAREVKNPQARLGYAVNDSVG